VQPSRCPKRTLRAIARAEPSDHSRAPLPEISARLLSTTVAATAAPKRKNVSRLGDLGGAGAWRPFRCGSEGAPLRGEQEVLRLHMPQVGRTRPHKTREKIHPPGRRAYRLTPRTFPKSVNPLSEWLITESGRWPTTLRPDGSPLSGAAARAAVYASSRSSDLTTIVLRRKMCSVPGKGYAATSCRRRH
jgi:hypothetical protein